MAVSEELRTLAGNLAAGIAAGALGTAAMTAAQGAEMKLTGRPASTTPAKAAEKVLHVEPNDEQAERTLSQTVHWGYGAGLGGACGFLAGLLLDREPETALVFFGLARGGGMVMLRTLGLAPSPTQWDAKSLLTDAGFHLVYAGATSAAYHGIKQIFNRPRPRAVLGLT